MLLIQPWVEIRYPMDRFSIYCVKSIFRAKSRLLLQEDYEYVTAELQQSASSSKEEV